VLPDRTARHQISREAAMPDVCRVPSARYPSIGTGSLVSRRHAYGSVGAQPSPTFRLVAERRVRRRTHAC